MTDITLGRMVFNCKEVFTVDDLKDLNLISLFRIIQIVQDDKKKQEFMLDVAQVRATFDPILTKAIISGPEIGGLLYSEYLGLAFNPVVLGAIFKSFQGMNLVMEDPEEVKKKMSMILTPSKSKPL